MATEHLDSDDLNTLLAEVGQGIGPDRSTLPDTALVRATRARMVDQVAEMRKKGITVDVGHEWPDVGPVVKAPREP